MKEITTFKESVRLALIKRMTEKEGWELTSLSVGQGAFKESISFFKKDVIYIPVDSFVIDEEKQ